MDHKNMVAESSATFSPASEEAEVAAFAERINVVIKRVGGVQKLADQMGVSASVLRSWRSGRSDPTRINVIKMARSGQVSPGWLMTGRGDREERDESLALATPDFQELEAIIVRVRQRFLTGKINLDLEIEARVIRLVYELYCRQGAQLDESSLNNIIELAMIR